MAKQTAMWSRPQKLTGNADFRNRCYLMKNGVPFSVLFKGFDDLMQHEKLAMQVTLSELDSGQKYNWTTGEYEERK